MRVLMLSWEYPPHIVGGMGRHVTDLSPALVANGVEVHLITPLLSGGPTQENVDGVHVTRVAVPSMEDYEFIAFVQQANHEMALAAQALSDELGHFDMVHAHDWLTVYAGTALKHHWRVPLMVTIHATERGRGRGHLSGTQAERINSLEWQLTYEAWRVIVCSQYMANELQAYFSTPADKIDVVPNGIQIKPNPFATPRKRLAFRRHFAADDEAIVYYVGRVVYEKGMGTLLAAWPLVTSERRARLVVAGAGGYLDTIKTQAWELGVTNSVFFTGFISDADRDRLYHIADVAAFPSLYEAFGIVALEAMAAGCPVVVSATGGLAEVVRPYDTGIAVPPGNPTALAWGITHTLDTPVAARKRALNALEEVRASYTWSHIAVTTISVYEQVYRAWLAGGWGRELRRPNSD